jgi:integrase
MAKESRGWFKRSKGSLVFCWNAKRPRDGKNVEQSKVVGPDDLSNEEGWIRVGKLGLDKLVGKPKDRNYTLGEVATAYLAKGLKKNGEPKAESTKDLDKQIVGDYIESRWGHHIAKDIEPAEVQDWLDDLKDKLANGTRSKIRSVMSAIYRYGQKYKMIPRGEEFNPMRFVSCGTQSDYEAKTVTPGEAFAIVEQIDDLLVRTLVILVCATALRISEALAFRWCDWIKHEKCLAVKQAWVRRRFGPPKSKASKGPVPVHPILASILDAWRAETPYAKNEDFIFPSFKLRGKQPRLGSMIDQDYLRPAAIRAKIITEECPRWGFHNFRHSLSTFLIKNGNDPRVVMRMLRQSTLDMTMHYTHMDDVRIDASGQLLEAMDAKRVLQRVPEPAPTVQ